MKSDKTLNSQLIAPCGINCGICIGFLRERNRCEGCWSFDASKSKSRLVCKIKNCEALTATDSKFCYDCVKFPCSRIKNIDLRYRTRYKMSNIDNLLLIKESGIENFIQLERLKWSCKKCGGTICVHRGFCLDCDKMSNKIANTKKQ